MVFIKQNTCIQINCVNISSKRRKYFFCLYFIYESLHVLFFCSIDQSRQERIAINETCAEQAVILFKMLYWRACVQNSSAIIIFYNFFYAISGGSLQSVRFEQQKVVFFIFFGKKTHFLTCSFVFFFFVSKEHYFSSDYFKRMQFLAGQSFYCIT